VASAQFPRPVLDLAESRRLGEPVRSFDARPEFRRAVIWLALLAPPGVLLVLSALFYLVEGPRWMGVGGALLAAAYLSGLWWIVRDGALRGRGQAVFVFEDGLVRLAPRRTCVHRFDELRSVTATARPGRDGRPRWSFTVADGDGEFVLSEVLPGVRELGEVIMAEIAQRELPRARAEFQAGRPVRFGPFTVDRTGVSKNGKTAPWEAIGQAGLGHGMVYVQRLDTGTRLTAETGLVPNALVFVELCRWAKTAPKAPQGR